MRLSQLFTKTFREPPKDEVAMNAQLLERAGFVFKNSAGIYTFLPLGWRVIQKIANIIREEINAIGGMEMFMPALIEKKYMEATGRWDVEIAFEALGKKEKTAGYAMGWSHEDLLTAIATKYVSSYKDLPFAVYQIQTKFRNEPRAKSGLLRGREFIMKDLYSFHADEKDFLDYYDQVKEAYHKVFKRCHLESIYTLAAGGDFTASHTHEFQVLSEIGEDTIFLCEKCGYAENLEVTKFKEGDACPKCGGIIIKKNSIEVGNIFPLGTKYSDALGLNFIDESGNKKPVIMGSYGIGLGRLMATIVELHNDKTGIFWPETVAPFKYHLISLEGGNKEADKLYQDLVSKGTEVLYDDRTDKTAGEKFADADLIGCPVRLVVSAKTLKENSVEVKQRDSESISLTRLDAVTLL